MVLLVLTILSYHYPILSLSYRYPLLITSPIYLSLSWLLLVGTMVFTKEKFC